MGRIRLDKMLFVDLEATCWEGEPPEGQSSEVIQIGVAELMLGASPRLHRTGSWLVRPRRSQVSGYCTALTGITGDDVKLRVRWLPEVCASIRKDFGGAGKGWAAWGRDDVELTRDCLSSGTQIPFSDDFTDLGALWSMLGEKSRPAGLSAALKELGLEFEGTPHRALDDAINTARVFIELSGALRDRTFQPSAASGPRP